MGQRLIPALFARQHQVKHSLGQIPLRKFQPAQRVIGDTLRFDSYTSAIAAGDTFAHPIGMPHPSPAKARQFREVDLASVQVALKAARDAGVRHFIYLSVARPAAMMKAFVEVRQQGEAMIRASGIPATFVRPWYVLGPGRRWPYAIIPVYWVMALLPATKESTRRLGLVRLNEMIRTLVWAVENPPEKIQILDVPAIRRLGRG